MSVATTVSPQTFLFTSESCTKVLVRHMFGPSPAPNMGPMTAQPAPAGDVARWPAAQPATRWASGQSSAHRVNPLVRDRA